MKTIAHRGFSAIAPENTLIAFKKALELKVDYIELDIHLTKDNQVVVIHDKTINRTANGKGKINELTLEEIRKYNVGSWFAPEYKNEKIPTLEEVMELVNGKATLFIEVKKGDVFYSGIEQLTLDLINKKGARDWCILHSFDDEIIRNIHHLDKTIPLFKTIELATSLADLYVNRIIPTKDIFYYKNMRGLNMNHQVVTHSLARKLHKKNLQLFVWTVNEPDSIKKMLAAKVDGIISNFPDRVLASKS